jgi:hypothetical protein
MSLSQAIYDYIRQCPLIDRKIRVRFNHLGNTPQEFSIDEVPGDVVVKQYIGSSIRQKTFNLTSRETYSQDQRINIEKSDFYESFSNWIETQSRLRNLPILDEPNTAHSITCLTPGYLYTATEDTAQYQIQLRLTYHHEGER